MMEPDLVYVSTFKNISIKKTHMKKLKKKL